MLLFLLWLTHVVAFTEIGEVKVGYFNSCTCSHRVVDQSQQPNHSTPAVIFVTTAIIFVTKKNKTHNLYA